jgi:hypothetical protein
LRQVSLSVNDSNLLFKDRGDCCAGFRRAKGGHTATHPLLTEYILIIAYMLILNDVQSENVTASTGLQFGRSGWPYFDPHRVYQG